MATFNTSIYNEQKDSRANPARLGTSNVASGDVQFAVIPYTIINTEVANDIINLCVLPAGAVPLPQLCRATIAGTPGTAFTLKVGTAADDDGLATSLPLTTSARDLPFTLAGAAQPAFLAPTPLVADAGSGNVVVYATVTTATSLNAGSTVYFTLAYKRAK